jgi:hypothetical protein
MSGDVSVVHIYLLFCGFVVCLAKANSTVFNFAEGEPNDVNNLFRIEGMALYGSRLMRMVGSWQ